jgi:hypothetical protein
MKKTALLALALMALWAGLAVAAPAAAPVRSGPDSVYVGMYVNRIYDVSLRDNKFSADFYLWFRWKNQDLDPIKSFEIVGGEKTFQSQPYRSKDKGVNYAFSRVTAAITQNWDISAFPFDGHVPSIQIEDGENEIETLVYVLDSDNLGKSPDIKIPGWALDKFYFGVVPYTYNTNYGDPSLPPENQSVFSRFYCSIRVIRGGIGYFVKLLFGMFIAAVIAFLAFFIKPTDLDPRFGLGVGGIFAAVASQYVITSSLPDTNIMTIADQLHIATFLFVFLSIAESTISLWLFNSGREQRSKTMDHFCRYAVPISYLLTCLLITLFR